MKPTPAAAVNQGSSLFGTGHKTLGLALLPILIFGVLALPELIDPTSNDDDQDQGESGETPEMPPVEPNPSVTIAKTGGEAEDALTREGGTLDFDGRDAPFVVGTDESDVIVASEGTDPELDFRLQAGDDL